MKITVELPDDLAKKAKTMAAQRGVTLRAIIEEGIRLVAREERKKPKFRLRNACVTGNGLQPEFRDRSWADIRDAAYEGRGS